MGLAATLAVTAPVVLRLWAHAIEGKSERERTGWDGTVTTTSWPSGPMIQREMEGVRGDGDGQDGHVGDGIGKGGTELTEVGYADDVGPRW